MRTGSVCAFPCTPWYLAEHTVCNKCSVHAHPGKGCPDGRWFPHHVDSAQMDLTGNWRTTLFDTRMSFPWENRLCWVIGNIADILRYFSSLTHQAHRGGISMSNIESDLGLKAEPWRTGWRNVAKGTEWVCSRDQTYYVLFHSLRVHHWAPHTRHGAWHRHCL